jgi:hypothetical protein
MSCGTLNHSSLVGIDADQMWLGPQWQSHTFEISHTICEGARVRAAELDFGPPPGRSPSSRRKFADAPGRAKAKSRRAGAVQLIGLGV